MSQIFNDIQICGFRGFPEIQLSDLGQVNLLVGNNNSGKTSILEAIAIFSNPLDPFRWLEVSQRSFSSGIFLGSPLDLESIKWIFEKREKKYRIGEDNQRILVIESQGNTPIKQLKTELIELYGTPDSETHEENRLKNEGYDYQKNETYQKHGLELKLTIHENENEERQLSLSNPKNQTRTETFEFWENQRFIIRSRKKSSINTTMICPSDYGSISVRLSKLILDDRENKNEILNLMKLFDADIIDIMILNPKKLAKIYIEHKKLGLAPLDIFGDGIKKTFAIAVALQDAKDGIVLIDEIENSIHVSAFSQVFSWLVESCFKQNTQLFVTTHSLEAIDTMIRASSNLDRIVGFQLNNLDNSVKRFSGDLLSRLRLNRGLDVR